MVDNSLVQKRLIQINAALDKSWKEKDCTNVSLFTGIGGLPLFYYMYFKLTNEVKYLDKIRSVVEELFDRLNNEHHSMNYDSGITGLAYMFEFLRENRILKDSEINENLNILDDLIIEHALFPISSYDEIDFLHGKLGIANYLLKRLPANKAIERCIHILFKNVAQVIEKDIWKTKEVLSLEDFNSNNHTTNCGLAHGHVSSIIILSKYLKKFPEKVYVKSVIRQLVDCMLNFAAKEDSELSVFPSIAVNRENANYDVHLGWCYGDQTASLGLYRASCVLMDKRLERVAKKIALRTLKRDTIEKALSPISDAGFCHGASGLSYLHKKWYQITGEIDFLVSYKNFLDIVLEKGENSDGVGRYQKILDVGKYENAIGLLDGYIGIGIVLIDSQMDNTFEWDQFFLLN